MSQILTHLKLDNKWNKKREAGEKKTEMLLIKCMYDLAPHRRHLSSKIQENQVLLVEGAHESAEEACAIAAPAEDIPLSSVTVEDPQKNKFLWKRRVVRLLRKGNEGIWKVVPAQPACLTSFESSTEVILRVDPGSLALRALDSACS